MRLTIAALLGVFIAGQTLAGPALAATAQQELMKTCNATATGQSLKGDARKTFMSDCLSGKEDTKPLTAQQAKMKTCNAQAAGKKGDERKTFMSTCLKS